VPDPKRQWLPLTAGTENVYVAKVPRTKVRLSFKKGDKPLANEPYTILGLGEPEEGVADGDGCIDAQIPVHVREIQVSFPARHTTYLVQVGDMDPVEEPSGLRKRLQHLGYYAAPYAGEDEKDAEATLRAAIEAFQSDNGLTTTGSLDDETKAKILEKHGG
jgi:hypothetical protein